MDKKKHLPPLLLLCSVILWPTLAAAGAWTLPQGTLWSKVTFFRQVADEWYIANSEFIGGELHKPGDRRPYRFDGKYDSKAVFLEAFYGVTDRLDVGIQLPYFDQRFVDSTRDKPPTDAGFSDIRFFSKFRLLQQPVLFTLKSGVKLATGEFLNEDGLIPVGEGQRDYELSGQVGRSFWPLPAYANLDLGYRIRTKNKEIDRDPGDEWFLNAEIGYSLSRKLMAAIKVEALRGDPAVEFGIIENRSQIKRITYVVPTLIYRATDRAALEVGVRYSLNGRNFPAGHQLVPCLRKAFVLFPKLR